MSILDDGRYEVTGFTKPSKDTYIFDLEIGKRIQVIAGYLYEHDYKDCIAVVIQNEKKSTPILLYTNNSYKSACNYEVLPLGSNEMKMYFNIGSKDKNDVCYNYAGMDSYNPNGTIIGSDRCKRCHWHKGIGQDSEGHYVKCTDY